MKEERYFYVPNAATNNQLPEEEAGHALRVLRLQSGDNMVLMDGKGTFYHAIVTLASHKKCLYEIQETLPQEKTWSSQIHLAIAPTKNIDRIEWLAEKVTEIGFDELSFLHCTFSCNPCFRRGNLKGDFTLSYYCSCKNIYGSRGVHAEFLT